MSRLPHALRAFAGAAALALTACSTSSDVGPGASFNPVTRFPVQVEPRMMTLRMMYRAGDLDQNMSEQLQRFAEDYLQHGSGAVAISAARGNPQAPAGLAARLADMGVPRSHIMVGNDDSEMGNEVRLTFVRYVAQATPCGDFSVNLGTTYDNLPAPNLGCATQNNIAVQVADPRDLVAPQPLGPGDAQHALTILEKYRNGETTVSAKAAEQSGNVSDVGK